MKITEQIKRIKGDWFLFDESYPLLIFNKSQSKILEDYYIKSNKIRKSNKELKKIK
ncbi:MAG: hypothetical protein GTO02_13520 [Candidatus Dadabacteria bacterium]|nr:hypothetical protein [Candidatus Dadabacteria bacterium]